MNEKAKYAKGPWHVGYPNVHTALNIGVSGREFIIADMCDHGYDEATQRANAALIAEAGTVYHETGLTPRQLAEQRKELLRALIRIMPFVDDSEDVQKLFPESACSNECREAVKLCRAAISNAGEAKP